MGYFDVGEKDCSQCSPICKTCEGTADFCTGCLENTFRELDNNSCLCQIGYIDLG